MKILNDFIYADCLNDFVEQNFQELMDFLLEKFFIYDEKFKGKFYNFLYQNIDNITSSLSCLNMKEKQILEQLTNLAYRYGDFCNFCDLCNSLDLQNNILIKTLKELSEQRDINKAFIAFNKAIFMLEKHSKNNEQCDIIFLNYIIVNFIYNKLFSKKDNYKFFQDNLNEFGDICNNDYSFLDRELLGNIFYFDCSNSQEFLDNFFKQINFYLNPNSDLNIKIECEYSEYSKDLECYLNITFDDVLKYARNYYKNNITDINNRYYNLNRGRAVLDNADDLFQYIHSFGNMHQKKLLSAFNNAKQCLTNYKECRVIDYGCGQGMGVMNLIDFINKNNLDLKIKEIILIEPSQVALSRAILHSKCFARNAKITAICKYLNDLNLKDLASDVLPTIQIFSNILDMNEVRLNSSLYASVQSSFGDKNLFFCVSPYGIANDRLDLFYEYFKEKFNAKQISNEARQIKPTKYEQIFEIIKY